MEIDATPLLEAACLKPILKFNRLVFQNIEDKTINLRAFRDESAYLITLINIISRKDKEEWQAFQSLLQYAVQTAQSDIKGVFGIDVISAELPQAEKPFQVSNLSQLVMNHAKKMQPGQKILIQYSQVFMILHYRVPADWGKVELEMPFHFFDPEKDSPERYIKRLIKKYPGSSSICLHDMSRLPIFLEMEQPVGAASKDSPVLGAAIVCPKMLICRLSA